jgi:NAD(P)-dependent dehydrogenase (short-subunit alcohol dehydrogenase family)
MGSGNLGGGLDVLVNNAAIGTRLMNPRFMVERNLTGYFLVAHGFLAFMVEQRHEKIINMSMKYETLRRKARVNRFK